VSDKLFAEHIERFNQGVRTGDFLPMLAGFAPDAELVFDGIPVGPFAGREQIAAAYAVQPPTDEIRLLEEPRIEDGALVADYAWVEDGRRAGRLILTEREGMIARLVVTFE
jgi:steroid delta-isomerase